MEDYVAADERPLNKCLKDVAACDFYIGILAFRYGYVPDQDNPRKKSITELESREAAKLKKPCLVFLLSEDAPWSAKFVDKGEAHLPIQALRDELGKERLASFFSNADELGQLVSTAVTNLVRERAGGGAPPEPDVPSGYLEWVKRECGSIELLGLRLKQGQSVRIGSVYVPLTTTLREEQIEDAVRSGKRGHRRETEGPAGRDQEAPLLLSLVDRHSLYISGAPGSGKSTFCRWLTWLLANGALPAEEHTGTDEGRREQFPQNLRRKLPVLIRLRDFHDSLPEARELTAHQFEGVLERWLTGRKPGGLLWAPVKARLASGEALLIFDGADEVPPSRRPAWISGLAQCLPGWQQQGNRILLTSRPYGLTDSDVRQLALPQAAVEKLAPELQRRLVRRWFRILDDDAQAAASTAEGLLADLRQRQWLVPLAENPLLLTAMCIVYGQGKRLPQDKYELYDRIVDTVLHNRFPPEQVPLVRNRLAVIARGMHTGAGLKEARQTPEAQTTEDEIDRMLEAYQEASSYSEEAFKKVNDTREQLLSQSGLLLPLDSRRASFYHLSFQEFLAAERMADVDRDRLLEVLRERGGQAEWRNTLSFLYGSQLANNVGPSRAAELLVSLLGAFSGSTSPSQAVLAADCVEILRGRGVRLQESKLNGVRDLCLAGVRGPRPAPERCAFGEALGRVGDPRFRADAWHLSADETLGFVEIPSGPFRMGSRCDSQARDNELRQFTAQVPSFLIGRYPVTVAQFRAFVEDREGNGGFQPGDADCLRGVDNHPVVLVSWPEALAYCRWLTAKLRSSKVTPEPLQKLLEPKPGGWQITLPSEAEWEKAARGTDGWIFPWEDQADPDKANYADTGVGSVSAVGCFLAGASPFGAEEMSGNVWEWTRSLWGEDWQKPDYGYPYQADDGREELDAPSGVLRVLRGGSCIDTALDARCANRNGGHPAHRYRYLGFRVVASPFPSSGL